MYLYMCVYILFETMIINVWQGPKHVSGCYVKTHRAKLVEKFDFQL